MKYEDIEGEILNSDGSVRLKPVASMSALRDGRARVGAALEKRGEEKDDGAMGGKSSAIGVGAEEHSGEESSQGPPKKKKKSKMHECEVCGKKFPRWGFFFLLFSFHPQMPPVPMMACFLTKLFSGIWTFTDPSSPSRPSGLKTHMNTHNNEKRKPVHHSLFPLKLVISSTQN